MCVLENFVMLGKTVPETVADGRLTVCTAGYDLELRKPIRIYPLARTQCPKRWSVSRIPVERNAKDNREESWKIRGDRSKHGHASINSVIETVQGKISESLQKDILLSLRVPSIAVANEKRLSLCVIYPTRVPILSCGKGDDRSQDPTPDMFGDSRDLPVMERFAWHPRLKFEDEHGRHDLMLRDWGCYELMRKYGDREALSKMEKPLNLELAPPILCGNFNRHRNSWLVISVFQGSCHARPHIIADQMSLI